MHNSLYLSSFFLVAATLMAGTGNQEGAAVFNADARMVLVPTTVMDRRGAIVSGLRSESFLVSQDNQPQRISSFGEQDVPASIGIVFDCSGSMRQVLPRAKMVLKTFFEASNPEDEAFLYTVASRPNRDSGFTQDLNSLLEHMIFTDAGGSTALVDTIFAALRQSRSAHHERKALLVISDGMDNHSRYSKGELISAALEADLQIYSITVYDPPLTKKPIELREERDGMAFLEEVTRRTGGIQAVVRNAKEMDEAAQSVARAIRDQYLIGYVPGSLPQNGSWHSIKVSLNVSNAKAYARAGFFAK
jgi:Ca-activated chloride channel family protein